jgi:hypothetical protein
MPASARTAATYKNLLRQTGRENNRRTALILSCGKHIPKQLRRDRSRRNNLDVVWIRTWSARRSGRTVPCHNPVW